MKNKEIHISYPERKCPACKSIDLIDGPRGGLCVNVLCRNCLREWNYTPLGFERIKPARIELYAKELKDD